MTTNQTTEESDVLHDAFVRQPMLTCIGNKRKLLQFLEQIIKDIRKDIGRKLKTMDACVGSGVVARLALIVRSCIDDDFGDVFQLFFVSTKTTSHHSTRSHVMPSVIQQQPRRLIAVAS